jgi:hypothetical protein
MKQKKDTDTHSETEQNTNASPSIIVVDGVKMFQKADGTLQAINVLPPGPTNEIKFDVVPYIEPKGYWAIKSLKKVMGYA